MAGAREQLIAKLVCSRMEFNQRMFLELSDKMDFQMGILEGDICTRMHS